MSATSSFEIPKFGDDGMLPDRRGWLAMPLTVMLWSLVFTIVYFATRDLSLEDRVAADGYIGTLLVTFIVTIFFVIPAATLLLGKPIDDATSHQSAFRSALTFALAGLILGTIPAVFIYLVNNAYGWHPFTQFIIPSAIAGYLSRVALELTVRNAAMRTVAIGFTVLVVVGSLAIGVSVFNGNI